MLDDALTKARLHMEAVSSTTPAGLPATSPAKIDPTSHHIYHTLLSFIKLNPPTSSMQNFCAAVLASCVDPVSGRGVLLRTNSRRPMKFSLGHGQASKPKSVSALTTDVLPTAIAKRVYRRAVAIESQMESTSDTVIGNEALLHTLAKRSGFLLLKRDELELSPAQFLALRDHMKNSTNGMCRLQQALKAFLPNLKILPSSVKKTLGDVEKDGVVPSKCVVVPDCLITKQGNKRAARNFYYSSCPSSLLCQMLRRLVLDGSSEDSQDFSSLQNMIVVSIGFDKSDSDFIGTWRICNRKSGNSSLFVQCFACLEGPVSECYGNESRTIGNGNYPVKDIVQSTLQDLLFALTIVTPAMSECAAFVFKPIPTMSPATPRAINVQLIPPVVNQAVVTFSSIDQVGGVPTIPVPHSTHEIGVSLVCSSDCASRVVGLIFVVNGAVAATHYIHCTVDIGAFRLDELSIHCQQISGHVSNYGKQINILNGQGSCSVGYPMPCCLVSKSDLGRPPEWLMRMFLRHVITAASNAAAVQHAEVPWGIRQLPDNVIDLIGDLSGLPVVRDAPQREGSYSFEYTHNRWMSLSRGGRHQRTQAEYQRDNASVGSSFHCPIILTPCVKENNGIMHTPCGHQNHYWKSICTAIRVKMKGCEWQVRLEMVDDLVDSKLTTNASRIRQCKLAVGLKVSKVNLFSICISNMLT